MKKLKVALTVFACSFLVACGGGSSESSTTTCTGTVSGYETEVKMESKGDEVKTIEYRMDQDLGITQEAYDAEKDSLEAMGDGIDGLTMSSSFKDGTVTIIMKMDLDELDLDSDEMKAALGGTSGLNRSLKSAKTEMKDAGLECK